MVTAVQHIARTIGIDLTQPAETQSSRNLLTSMGCTNDTQLEKMSPGRYLESIYDAVVGINERQASRFSRNPDGSRKLDVGDLNKLIAVASAMLENRATLPGRSKVLHEVRSAALTYKDFLERKTNVVKKNLDGMGNRHTLIRTDRDEEFEMTNSMTSNEISRFGRVSGKTMEEVQAASESKECNDKTYFKVRLGSGSVGTTRIARNINSGDYVAVKKSHPRLVASTEYGIVNLPPLTSSLTTIPDETLRDATKIGDAVVLPLDRCALASKRSERAQRIAEDFSDALPASERDLQEFVRHCAELDQALKELDKKEFGEFIKKSASNTFSEYVQSPPKTNYEFSDLGITTIEKLISSFNLIRGQFEGATDFDELTAIAREMIEPVSQIDHLHHYNIHTHRHNIEPGTPESERAGAAFFNSEKFKLTDSVYNQRFLNTLAKKSLVALSTFHSQNFSHRDIKSDNIVLLKDKAGNINVKLIDLDQIEVEEDDRRELAEMGAMAFRPPEGTVPESDGTISYTGKNGDSFAMGMTLRRILGFSNIEIVDLADEQKTVKLVDAMKHPPKLDRAEKNRYKTKIKEYKEKLSASNLKADVRVQSYSRIRAILKAAPDALTLKDVSDLMLHHHPGKRYASSEALELPFFQKDENFLSEKEFSDTLELIGCLGMFADKEAVRLVNYDRDQSAEYLPALRQIGADAMMNNRGHTPDKATITTLSPEEAKAVAKAELKIKAKSTAQRVVKRFVNTFSGSGSIADAKLGFKRS